MRRRSLLQTGMITAACAAGAALAPPAVAQRRRELTMITAWPKKTPGLANNAERFADSIAQLTDGRLSVKVYEAGALVAPFEAFGAVSDGTVDLCHSSSYFWVGKHKAFNFFTGVPFGFTAQEMAAWLSFGGGQALWEELYQPFGILPFYAGSSGVQAFGWLRREVNSLSDLRGLKFRIGGLGSEILQRLGATPVMTPPAEMLPALMSGDVDGVSGSGPWADTASGLYRGAKYYYVPGLFDPGPALEIIVNKKLFENLTKDEQAAIRVAAQAVGAQTLADFGYHNTLALEPLLKDYGVEIRHFSPEIIRAMAKAAGEVVSALGEGDALSKKIYASYASYLKQCRTYSPIGEGGYLADRQLAYTEGPAAAAPDERGLR